MVDAPDGRELARAPVGLRSQGDAYARGARDNVKPPDDGCRAENAATVLEAWSEVDDFQDSAVFRFKPCSKNGRIAIIGL